MYEKKTFIEWFSGHPVYKEYPIITDDKLLMIFLMLLLNAKN